MRSSPESPFRDHLSALKDKGSAILVTGPVPEERFSTVTTQLLGDQDTDPRRRIVVTKADTLDGVHNLFPNGSADLSAESARVIRMSDQERSVAVGQVSDSVDLPMDVVPKQELSTLSERLYHAINEFDERAGSLAPAELRVSVDTLASLLDAHDEERVFRFIHLVNNMVRKKSGMVHYHLPMERDSSTVRVFAPLFDALVELRMHNGELQQRWHLRDADVSSDWLPV